MLSLCEKKLIGFQCESNMVENKRLLSTKCKTKVISHLIFKRRSSAALTEDAMNRETIVNRTDNFKKKSSLVGV